MNTGMLLLVLSFQLLWVTSDSRCPPSSILPDVEHERSSGVTILGSLVATAAAVL